MLNPELKIPLKHNSLIELALKHNPKYSKKKHPFFETFLSNFRNTS